MFSNMNFNVFPNKNNIIAITNYIIMFSFCIILWLMFLISKS